MSDDTPTLHMDNFEREKNLRKEKTVSECKCSPHSQLCPLCFKMHNLITTFLCSRYVSLVCTKNYDNESICIKCSIEMVSKLLLTCLFVSLFVCRYHWYKITIHYMNFCNEWHLIKRNKFAKNSMSCSKWNLEVFNFLIICMLCSAKTCRVCFSFQSKYGLISVLLFVTLLKLKVSLFEEFLVKVLCAAQHVANTGSEIRTWKIMNLR